MYVQVLNPNDPLFSTKSTIIESNNYLHDKTRQDKERMYSKIYFAVSLVLTILASFFIRYLNLASILILMNLLILFLIFFAINYRKLRARFWSNRKKMKETYKNLGLEWRD